MTSAIDPLQARLTPLVGVLRASYVAGDTNAGQVIALYNMYVRCPEAGARTICECFLDAWLLEHPEHKP